MTSRCRSPVRCRHVDMSCHARKYNILECKLGVASPCCAWQRAYEGCTAHAQLAMASKERPRSAYDGRRAPKNEHWGTITETNRGLGNQPTSKDDVDAIVERLSTISPETRIPDSQRTGSLKQSGIMNSYAWTGY